MWGVHRQASPIWSRRNRLDRGSARSARQPGLLPISAPQARAHRANQVGAAPCRLGADDGPLISFPFPVLQSRSRGGLRHSRAMTRVGSRNLTQRPAFGGDDNAFPTCGLRIKARRFWWVTLSEHKWVILGERRGRVTSGERYWVTLLPSTQESRRGDEGPGQLPVGRASGSGPETHFGGSGSCHVAKALPKTRLRVRMHSGP